MFWAKPYSKTLVGSKKHVLFNFVWNILALNPENKPKKIDLLKTQNT